VLAVADCEPDGPDDPAVTRDDVPEDDPLELDPPRDVAELPLLLDDDEGVRDPAGVWGRGISTTRAGSGALELAPPDEPDETDEPDEPDDPPAGRGIA
jgi:hypothetical protein